MSVLVADPNKSLDIMRVSRTDTLAYVSALQGLASEGKLKVRELTFTNYEDFNHKIDGYDYQGKGVYQRSN